MDLAQPERRELVSDEPGRPRRSEQRHGTRRHALREVRGPERAATTRSDWVEPRRKPKRSPLDAHARRRRIGRVAIIVGVVLLLLLGVGGAYAYNFVRSIDAKIHPVVITDPTLAAELQQQAPPPGAPFYALLIGSDGRPAGSAIKGARSDTLMVARVDPQKKTVLLVSIMRDSRVNIPGYGMNKINAAYSFGGTQLALETVRQLTGLPITKYIDVGFTGFETIVDAMGGVWFNVPEYINGVPNGETSAKARHDRILQKGYQKLDGLQALTFVRERHQFANQDYTRVKDQQAFLKALAKQALQIGNVLNAPQIINAVADDVNTNMSLTELADLVIQMKGLKDTDFQTATLPSSATSINGVSYVIIDQAGMKTMFARMQAGGPLVPGAKTAPSTAAVAGPAPSTISLTIRNGAGVPGLATRAAAFFTSRGFKISDTGNANQYVYGQTLIVYKPSTESKAAAVAKALGYGTVTPAAGMYTFNGDILVVVGKDWKVPSSSATP
jgi:LCP family protein required for cell wall assembly